MTSIRVHPSRPRSPIYPPSYELNYPQTSAVNANVLPEVTNAVPLAYDNNDNTNLEKDNDTSVCFIFAFGFIVGLIIGLVI